MAKGAVRVLREKGIRAGLFRPQTLWPFPVAALERAVAGAERVVVVEASNGQLEDELRLAASHAGLKLPPIQGVRRYGGVLPSVGEIVEQVSSPAAVPAVRG
jgi:pyruvate/2-oxoacid:ferredoxin oxidoreductase alpha subunit